MTSAHGGSIFYVYGPTISNAGTIQVFENGGTGVATLQHVGNVLLQGSGDLILNGRTTAVINTFSGVLTQAAGHTIHGAGSLNAIFSNVDQILGINTALLEALTKDQSLSNVAAALREMAGYLKVRFWFSVFVELLLSFIPHVLIKWFLAFSD